MGLSAAEIRRFNLDQAVKAAGGVPAFCRVADQNPDYIRQLLRGNGNKGGRNIGDKTARKLEKLLGKPTNWLDQVHGPVAVTATQAPTAPDPAFAAAKLRNDMEALRIAVGALFVEMAASRPDAAARVAATIRLQVDENFQDRGLMFALLEVLDTGTAAKARSRVRKPDRPA